MSDTIASIYDGQPDQNHVFLTGSLADDPNFRSIPPNNLPVANAKLITVSKFLTTHVNRRTSIINLVFYGPFVELARPLKKGSRLAVHGELHIRPTSKTSISTTTEIIVQTVHRIQDEAPKTTNRNDTDTDVSSWG